VKDFLHRYAFLESAAKSIASPVKLASSPAHKRVKAHTFGNSARTRVPVPDLPPLPAEHRTSPGQVISKTAGKSKPQASEAGPAGRDVNETRQIIDAKHLTRSDQRGESDSPPFWLQNLLQDWHNPVFPVSRKAIRTVQAPVLPRLKDYSATQGANHPNLRQLDKRHLQDVSFIAQVDAKFLLLTSRTDDGMALLLVDQHAADERVRVESFFKQYCDDITNDCVVVVALRQAKIILLTGQEVREVDRYREALSRFGILVESSGSAVPDSEYGQVSVLALPALLMERLSTEDRLLRNVIREFLLLLEQNGSLSRLGRSSWATMLGHLPATLVDLINSKARRGKPQ
jgi:DNA mismatch repair ATPase MutL